MDLMRIIEVGVRLDEKSLIYGMEIRKNISWTLWRKVVERIVKALFNGTDHKKSTCIPLRGSSKSYKLIVDDNEKSKEKL